MSELKPMPIDEALATVKRVAAAGRAIQRDIDQIMAEPNNVADQNPHDVPLPSQVDRAAFERELLRSGLELGASAGKLMDAIKKHVFHEHPLIVGAVVERIREVRLACQDIETTVLEGPTPNTVLGPGNEKREESVAKVKVAPQA